MLKTAFIGIGSNVGDKLNNCLRAIEFIGRLPGSESIGHSGLYETKPVGVEDQDWYVNSVASLSTGLSAHELLKNLLDIESDMGRIRMERWEPRIIDLDILIFGNEIIHDEALTVPHPLMHVRKFVLVPMAELAPDRIHPTLGIKFSELLSELPEDDQVVHRIKEK